MNVIGLIAGSGSLPLILSQKIKRDGLKVVSIAFKGLSSEDLSRYSDITHWINLGELGSLIKILKKEGIRKAIMVGKVPKTLMFSEVNPDLRAVTFFMKLKDKKDDSILMSLADELEAEGIVLEKLSDYLDNLFSPKGVIASRSPSDEEMKDVQFGWNLAKEIGRLDIGQTVVVKNQAALAVEAIEGTDEAIRRGGELGKGDVVVVKVSKPQQDMRFDVPVVGLRTMDALEEAKAKVLALEAGRTIIIEKDEMIRRADKISLSIIGI